MNNKIDYCSYAVVAVKLEPEKHLGLNGIQS